MPMAIFSLKVLVRGSQCCFYAIDGQYRTYQQGAKIEPGMTTTANVKLTRAPAVNITFVVNQLKDALERRSILLVISFNSEILFHTATAA